MDNEEKELNEELANKDINVVKKKDKDDKYIMNLAIIFSVIEFALMAIFVLNNEKIAALSNHDGIGWDGLQVLPYALLWFFTYIPCVGGLIGIFIVWIIALFKYIKKYECVIVFSSIYFIISILFVIFNFKNIWPF